MDEISIEQHRSNLAKAIDSLIEAELFDWIVTAICLTRVKDRQEKGLSANNLAREVIELRKNLITKWIDVELELPKLYSVVLGLTTGDRVITQVILCEKGWEDMHGFEVEISH